MGIFSVLNLNPLFLGTSIIQMSVWQRTAKKELGSLSSARAGRRYSDVTLGLHVYYWSWTWKKAVLCAGDTFSSLDLERP